ncbi:CIC11C00000003706 [Sungouiella intermedia]|uniref:V-type proton ATPase subunit C n=1 Tax=Sungouiella intermedia TaxID=45354 RepID=A0A1L0DCZ4_9ASCO|nr:CIC11C00000003706 [[Candida] intermedia]
MESTQYLVVSLPQSANAYPFLERQLNLGKQPLAEFKLPDFQIKTLDSLVQLSEEIAKLDSTLAASVTKVVDVVQTVEPNKLFNETRVVNLKPATWFVEHFTWNTSKYRLDKPIKDLVQLISSEALSLDNDVRLAYQQYQGAKSNFLAADRKKNGDLSIKSLHEIVRPEHFVLDSDHLTTVLVAVPKSLVSDFEKSYESLNEWVIPRSAQEISRDSEYVLYAVAVFTKYQNDFVSATREHKWHPRTDFVYLEENLNELRKEFDLTKATETKSKNDLIRLSKTAYSEIFSAWFHIKAIRIYIESVLRYGLPPQFDAYAIKFEGKNASNVDKAKKELIAKFGYLGGDGFSELSNLHEYASLVDSDYEPFVLYQVEIV